MDVRSAGRRRAAFAAAALLLALIVALVASELAVRVAKRFVCVGRGVGLYAPHRSLGWAPRPGAEGWQYGCYDRRFEFRTYVRINSLGLRDHEIALGAPADTLRVLLLGDSITEAVQVELEQTFAKLIERELDSRHRRVEVINAGVAAYGTDNALKFYRERARQLGADLVVLMFNLQNDVAENHPELFERLYGSEVLHLALVKAEANVGDDGEVRFETDALARHVDSLDLDERGRPGGFGERVRRMSYVARTLSRWLEGPPGGVPLETAVPVNFWIYQTPPDAMWEEAWQRTAAFVHALRREVEADGTRFAAAIIPAKDMVDERWWKMMELRAEPAEGSRWELESPRRRALGLFESAGVDVFDLTAPMRERQRQRKSSLFFTVDVHLTPLGHQTVAEALAPVIQARLAERSGPAR